jgi:hypothetical protein
MCGAIDPDARLFVFFDGVSGGSANIWQVNVDTGAFREVTSAAAANGCASLLQTMSGYPGVAYDPTRKTLVVYPGTAGDTVYDYDAATATCTSATYPNGPSSGSSGAAKGITGRFRYVPGRSAYVVVTGSDQPAFALCRQSGGC